MHRQWDQTPARQGLSPSPEPWADAEHQDGQAWQMGLSPSAAGAGRKSLGLSDPAEALPGWQGCDLICRVTATEDPSCIFTLDLRFFCLLELKQEILPKSKHGVGEKTASLQLLDRSKKWVS